MNQKDQFAAPQGNCSMNEVHETCHIGKRQDESRVSLITLSQDLVEWHKSEYYIL